MSRDDALDAELDRLYGLPLGEFTAARNALAHELKGSGDAEGAKRVGELKKPTRSAGAINRAVRARRREAKAVIRAAEELQEAQAQLLQGGGRKPVERAAGRERAAVDRFMSAVDGELEGQGGASSAMHDRARSTLHALPGDPDLRSDFEGGRITKDHEAVGFGALSVAAAPPAPKEPRSTERKEAQRRLKRAERDLEMAERRLRRVRDRAEKLQEQLDAANAAVVEAEGGVADAVNARDVAAKAAGE